MQPDQVSASTSTHLVLELQPAPKGEYCFEQHSLYHPLTLSGVTLTQLVLQALQQELHVTERESLLLRVTVNVDVLERGRPPVVSFPLPAVEATDAEAGEVTGEAVADIGEVKGEAASGTATISV